MDSIKIKTSEKIFKSINPFRSGFYYSSKLLKFLITLLNAWNIIKICHQHNIDILFSATPSIFIRLSILFLKNSVNHISYLRSAYPVIDDLWSDSEKMYKYISKFNIPLASFINPYSSDLFLVSGEANRVLLLYKGFPKNRIKIMGPAKLNSYRKKTKKINKSNQITIIYATQSFNHHNDNIGHHSQLVCLESLLEESYLSDHSINFILRIHPRDKISFYSRLIEKYKEFISIENYNIESFLESVSSQRILVSSTSTLLFEWGYLGGKSYSIGTSEFIIKYRKFFDNVHLKPFSNAKYLLYSIVNNKNYISKNSINQLMSNSNKTEKWDDIFGKPLLIKS